MPTGLHASSSTAFYGDYETKSEDCLYLNVWTPAKSAGDKLPVLVWIHGGGFRGGSGTERLHHGDNFAAKGVVLVTFNYRLGVFGFLAHPELTVEAGTGASGNYGLMDQIAALKWVQKNIASFGGDPRRVTIFGESAGSGSVSYMQASPMAAGLFQGAIGESGGQFSGRGVQKLADAEKNGLKFAELQAALDFAYQAIGRTAEVAKQIVAKFYGRPAAYSYFSGCSTGGREAMIMTQRYPTYFRRCRFRRSRDAHRLFKSCRPLGRCQFQIGSYRGMRRAGPLRVALFRKATRNW